MRSVECDAIHRASVTLSVEDPGLALILMRAARQYEAWEHQTGAHAQSADVIEFRGRNAP